MARKYWEKCQENRILYNITQIPPNYIDFNFMIYDILNNSLTFFRAACFLNSNFLRAIWFEYIYTHRQFIKKANFWNSEPARARSRLAMVALCSGDFKHYSDASSITPCQFVVDLDALEWVCAWYPRRFFCKLKNEGSWVATRLRQILFRILCGPRSDILMLNKFNVTIYSIK